MCGFLVSCNYRNNLKKSDFIQISNKGGWRGPDFFGYYEAQDGAVKISHHRLSILDLTGESNQPLLSDCGRYVLVYNGEIYNYRQLEVDLNLNVKSASDSLFLLHAYQIYGPKILEFLDGMFAFVVYDTVENSFFAARDHLGIKPLFYNVSAKGLYFGSEARLVADLCGAALDPESLLEWESVRRPSPGYSYFSGVNEVLPGHYFDSKHGTLRQYWRLEPEACGAFDQDYFQTLLADSVRRHCMADVPVVSMLSGGIDSAIITKLSGVSEAYTVGLKDNNEFCSAHATANEISCELTAVEVKDDDLIDSWRVLTRLRGEPLSVPNEGLIYHLCKNLSLNEKVILTGEGADELGFGYDRIFTWALENAFNPDQFFHRYSYGPLNKSSRLPRFWSFVDNLRMGKTNIEFLEDFFIQFHLPGLLRRMDFASMAASKEARVPFVSVKLFKYLYRRASEIKILNSQSKVPIRKVASALELNECLSRPKIGFSASIFNHRSRAEEYAFFQSVVRKEL